MKKTIAAFGINMVLASALVASTEAGQIKRRIFTAEEVSSQVYVDQVERGTIVNVTVEYFGSKHAFQKGLRWYGFSVGEAGTNAHRLRPKALIDDRYGALAVVCEIGTQVVLDTSRGSSSGPIRALDGDFLSCFVNMPKKFRRTNLDGALFAVTVEKSEADE